MLLVLLNQKLVVPDVLLALALCRGPDTDGSRQPRQQPESDDEPL